MIFFISMKVFLFEACHHLQDLFFLQFLLNPQGKAGEKKKKKKIQRSCDSYNPNPIARKMTGRGHHTGQLGHEQGGKTEKLSPTTGHWGHVAVTCGSLDGILEQKGDSNGRTGGI